MSSQEIKDGQKIKRQESPKKKVEGCKKIRYSFSLDESDSDSGRNSSEDSDRGRGLIKIFRVRNDPGVRQEEGNLGSMVKAQQNLTNT